MVASSAGATPAQLPQLSKSQMKKAKKQRAKAKKQQAMAAKPPMDLVAEASSGAPQQPKQHKHQAVYCPSAHKSEKPEATIIRLSNGSYTNPFSPHSEVEWEGAEIVTVTNTPQTAEQWKAWYGGGFRSVKIGGTVKGQGTKKLSRDSKSRLRQADLEQVAVSAIYEDLDRAFWRNGRSAGKWSNVPNPDDCHVSKGPRK